MVNKMNKPVANSKHTRYVFNIYAKTEEAGGEDVNLEIIAHTKNEAITKVKEILGEEYRYLNIREIIAFELYKLKEC